MKMKMKSESHRYDINRPMSRHGRKYSKHNKCLARMMLICIKQNLSSVYEKIKQHWGWVEKSVAYKRSVYFFFVTCKFYTFRY